MSLKCAFSVGRVRWRLRFLAYWVTVIFYLLYHRGHFCSIFFSNMGSPGGDPFSNCLAISAWTKVVGKPIYCQCYPQCHDGCLRCFYFVQSAPLSTPPAISLSPQAHAFLRTCSSPPVHHVSLDIPASTDHLTPTSTSSPVHIPKSSPVADTPASSEPH